MSSTIKTRPHRGMQVRWTGSTDGDLTAMVTSNPTTGEASFAGNRVQPSVVLRWEDGIVTVLTCPDGYLPSDYVDTGI